MGIMCFGRGHELLTHVDGSHRYEVCARCGYRTPGVRFGEPAAETFGTQPYWDRIHAEIYDEIMEVEMTLHGGG